MNIPQRAREMTLDLRQEWTSTKDITAIEAFAAEVERDALERAINAIRKAYVHGFETFGETAIRALIATPTPERPDPTVALAKLFRLLWEGSHLSPIAGVVDVADLARVVDGGGQWEPTTLGDEALRIAKENECG